MSSTDHLIRMANDIGDFFRAQPRREDAVAGIANHIRSFWTPRMRAQLAEELERGVGGLDDLPREALMKLTQNSNIKPELTPGGDAG
jgi:formate dehydrogenase subunit delta